MADKAEEARRLAQDYLASLPGAEATPPPPPTELPLPPAPGLGTKIAQGAWQGAKDSAKIVGGALVGGPIGAGLATNHVTSKNMPKAPPVEQPEAPHGPIGPPEAPPNDAPLILPYGGGAGAGRMVSPAGMYPHSMTTQAHMGKPVPEETRAALGAATNMKLTAADEEGAANRDYHSQIANLQAEKLRANEEAAARHARIQADRDSIVKQRMARIEAANTEANAAIDPNKAWHDKSAAAQVLGLIAIGVGGFADRMLGRENGALKIMQTAVQRELDAQIANRQNANANVARQERLLDMHMNYLDSQDKAVEATRLGLWDNIATQIDRYAAENQARIDPAKALNMKALVLEQRGEVANKLAVQETDDVQRAYSEQWQKAQYAGGGAGGKGNMEGLELIPVPASDQTSEKGEMIAVPKGSHQKLGEVVGATNAIIGINQDALARIKEMEADKDKVLSGDLSALKRFNANRKTLNDLAQRKASLISSAEGQGVLKEAEFERAMSDRVHFNDWYRLGSDVQKRIQAQNNGLAGAAGRMVQGVGGQRVQMAYRRDVNGAIQPNPLFTGKMYTPPPVAPEMEPVK